MKRWFCWLLTALCVVSLAAVSVRAEDSNEPASATETTVHTIVLLGDSISAGFGMPGFESNDPSKAQGSFSNLLAEHYRLTYGQGMFNYAHTGLTSSEILTSLRHTDTDVLKQADMIVLSAGSNDILNILGESVYRSYQESADELRQQGILIDFSDLRGIEQTILTVLTDPSKKEVVDRFLQLCTNQQVQTRCQDAVLQCESNTKEMISYLREIGSQAEVFVITPYNPTTAVIQNRLSDLLQNTMDDLRKRLLSLSESAEYGYAVSVVDLLTDFEGKYLEMTNITSGDIHPSAAGHRWIADTIIRRMKLLSEQRTAQQQAIRHRTAPVADSWVYLLFSVAALCVIGILFYVVILHRKK